MNCALVGRALGHSHSPRIHQAFGYGYELKPVEPEGLLALLAEEGYGGFNVTIPYKKAAIAACAGVDPLVERIGALNTIVRRPDGSNWGYNTDYAGFLALAERAGIAFSGRKALVLGSGGTSRTVCAALWDSGAREVLTVSRSGEINYNTVNQHIDAEILINTTPCGMYPNLGEQPLSLAGFPNLSGVIDVVYNPLRTLLIQQAERLGIPSAGGLYMLAAQARAAGELFLGRGIPERQFMGMYAALERDLTDLVLIGMPGSGKSTLGRMAALRLKREFVDVDEVIEAQAGHSIPELFAREGEKGFRARERRAIEGLCRGGGRVIAAGGGAPLHPDNRIALRRNGWVLYVERDPRLLEQAGRPLSLAADSMEALRARRLPAYLACADAAIENNTSPEQALQAILEGFDAHFDR